MGEFLIECTLCGVSYGSEKQYDAHPCMDDDVKIPFKIKMEPDDEEAELEEEVQKVLDQATVSCKIEPVNVTCIKEEPSDVDFEDVDPLGIGQDEEFANADQLEQNTSVLPESSEASEKDKDDSSAVEAANEAKGINECLVCGKRFFRREDFLTHKMNSHKVPRPYECTVCKKRFTQKHYVALHMRVHTGERPYKCGLCSNTYTHKTSFTIHMRIHNGDRPYRCGLCGKRCYDKSGLTSHMRSHTKETPYECEVCGRRFTHSKSLLVHRRNHTGEKPYTCQYCGKSFRHWHKHKIHIRLHTGERPYRCKVCGKGFPRNDEVKRHMRSHQGIKSFKCSICSVYCATQASITGHIDLHHSDLKPDNPSAPEKTVVRNSLSGILGTKAPQPRTIYKPIASLAASFEVSTSTGTSVMTTAQNKGEIAGKTGSDGKPKTLSYKEYMDMQEKMLTEKGLMFKESKNNSKNLAPVTVNSASTSKKTLGVHPQNQSILTNNGKQIMILSPQNIQSGGGLQFVLPRQVTDAMQVRTTAGASTNVPGQQLILNPSSMMLPQTQVLGGQVLGGQQLILLTGNQQNNSGGSQPVFLLTGGNGGTGQRLVLLPKQASGSVIGGNQMIMLNNTQGGTNDASSIGAVQIKQEVIEPTPVVSEENVLNTVIKQEPGSHLCSGIVIKQEPEENNAILSSNFCNVVIKQEPQDLCE